MKILKGAAKFRCNRNQDHIPGCSTCDYVQAYFTKYNNTHTSIGQVTMQQTNLDYKMFKIEV
jgi:hypothetical protein